MNWKRLDKKTVYFEMNLPKGKICQRKLRDVLWMPNLLYNLLSVSKVQKGEKMTKFDATRCLILGEGEKLLALATKVDSLYYLNCKRTTRSQQVIAVETQEYKESLWHRQFGHLGVKNLQKLARDKMLDSFDFNTSSDPTFCETCVVDKHHKSQFPKGTTLLVRKSR